MAVPNYFIGIFGRSPFDPLQEHMGLCERAAAHIEELLTRAGEGAWAEVDTSIVRSASSDAGSRITKSSKRSVSKWENRVLVECDSGDVA